MISRIMDVVLKLLRLPGDSAVEWLADHAPAVAAFIRLGETGGTIAIVVSAIVWLVLLILAGILFDFVDRLDRTLTAWVSGLYEETKRVFRVLRRRIVSTIGLMRQRRRERSPSIDVVELELEQLETAVLRCHAAVGEVRVMAAADVAGVLRVPPRQVARALARLREYRLVEPGFGTDEGREGHHITQAGQIYLIEH